MTDDHHGRSTRLDAVVREQGIDAPAGESPASVSDSGAGPRVAHVPKPHVHDTFSVEGSTRSAGRGCWRLSSAIATV